VETFPNPTGTIDLADSLGNDLGSCVIDTLGNCSIAFNADQVSLPSDQNGPYTFTVTASYSGDDNYSPSSTSFDQTVDCETYTSTDDPTYDYTDEFDASGNYWYDSCEETQATTTYNCEGNQIGDPSTSTTNCGTQECGDDGVALIECDCSNDFEVEANEWTCDHGDYYGNYYYDGYYCGTLSSDESCI
jgi:hypothetical protein